MHDRARSTPLTQAAFISTRHSGFNPLIEPVKLLPLLRAEFVGAVDPLLADARIAGVQFGKVAFDEPEIVVADGRPASRTPPSLRLSNTQ